MPMTTNSADEARAPVIQADRDAAQKLSKWLSNVTNGAVSIVAEGDAFGTIQAFARHRLSHASAVGMPSREDVARIATVRAFDAAQAECRRLVEQTTFADEVMPGDREWYKRGAQACAAAMGMLASTAAKAVPLGTWSALFPAQTDGGECD